jgi:hypothetical protein
MDSLIKQSTLRLWRAAAGLATTLAVALTLSTAATAQGQTPTLRNATPFEYPTYPGWIFTPTFATGGTWDDNLLLAHADDVVLRDYATPVRPSLRLEYRGRRTLWSSSYDSSFLIYRDVSELNSSDQAVDIRLRQLITRNITLSGHESYAKVPTTDALTLGAIPFFRIGARTNDLGAGLEARLSRTMLLELAYTHTSVDFESAPLLDAPLAVAPVAGGYAHQGSVSLEQKFSRRLTLGARYQLRRAILADDNDRVNIQDATITAQYQVTPTTDLSGFAGVARIAAGLQHREQTGPSLGISISRQLTKATLISVGYQRTFIPSWAFGGTFQNQEFFATVRVPFARNHAYVEGRGTLLDAEALDPGQPNLRSLWVGTVIGYRFTRWLRLEGYYDRSGQDTNRPGGDRHRNIFGFRIVTAKPMKLG